MTNSTLTMSFNNNNAPPRQLIHSTSSIFHSYRFQLRATPKVTMHPPPPLSNKIEPFEETSPRVRKFQISFLWRTPSFHTFMHFLMAKTVMAVANYECEYAKWCIFHEASLNWERT